MLLQQPGRIGPLKLKNRVVMAPMGTNYSTTDGLSTQRDRQYYAERAKGGLAMIMTEAMVVTEHARPHNNSLCVYHDRFIPGLASIVEAIKEHHAERLEALRVASHDRGWATVNELMRDLFKERSWSHMAESETYAHLEHLRLLGDAERREDAGHALYLVP